MQQREAPIEGANDSQAISPARTGDFLFGGTAAPIAAIVMVIFIVLR
ncbi:MAG: hypothetical protein ACR2M3_09555 [Thermomicrobiales bacterium]